jgi:hypothetical protein
MEESATYQAIIRKGAAMGRAEGREEGRKEQARRMLLLLGEIRLDPPDASVVAAVEAITDVERLEDLVEQMLDAESWQQLFPPQALRVTSALPASGIGFAPLPPEHSPVTGGRPMIRKLKSGQYRLYSKKTDPRTGKRRNLGTFATRQEAEQHERAVQFFKHRH